MEETGGEKANEITGAMEEVEMKRHRHTIAVTSLDTPLDVTVFLVLTPFHILHTH